ncbi:uncharacterized protein RCO7_11684 [Rhynchosporium graminicola]|uniref:Protein kinase domain-containing protein n=1 Tax=Rhynchosporium graminicola TaxID=2792576 RepID=A0A1E1K8U8_9HELO|nr:uncharacterized protein RCO7_11684 [Rhynchosporium commune]
MFAGRLWCRFPSPRLLFHPSTRIIRSAMASQQYSIQAMLLPPLPPRAFHSTGFEVIDPSQLVEEERLPFYNCDHYYPMRISEVLKDRYQVVAKLSYSLCRDLRQRSYQVIKAHVNTLKHNQELEVFNHLASITREHSAPLGISIRTLQDLHKDKILAQSVIKGALNQVLFRLNFLHKANVIHTDLHSDNLLIAIIDDSILSKVEEDEIRSPSARKQAWDFLEPEGLFGIYDKESEELNNAHHLAAITALLRPPPPKFLIKGKNTSKKMEGISKLMSSSTIDCVWEHKIQLLTWDLVFAYALLSEAKGQDIVSFVQERISNPETTKSAMGVHVMTDCKWDPGMLATSKGINLNAHDLFYSPAIATMQPNQFVFDIDENIPATFNPLLQLAWDANFGMITPVNTI